MANKEALRDLQSRLAQRMQRAGADGAQSWLAVECRGLGVLLPLEQAGEIHAPVATLPVPHTQPWFRGVANLRGGLYGIVDLGAYLGLAAVPESPALRDQARFVAVNPRFGVNCAVLVDRLAGLKRADQMRCEPVADDGRRPGFAGDPWIDEDGRAWQEVKLAELAADEQFLAIAN